MVGRIACAAVLALGLAPAQAGGLPVPVAPSGALGQLAPPGALGPLAAGLAAATLAATIRAAEAEARAAGVRPLTPAMRAPVAALVPARLLDRARWTLAPPPPSLIAALFAGPADAVTLGDVIVFRDAAAAGDARLLAHEMVHVDQFDRWGVEGFARRYALGWDALEAEARAIERRVGEGWSRAGGDARSPRPVRRPAR